MSPLSVEHRGFFGSLEGLLRHYSSRNAHVVTDTRVYGYTMFFSCSTFSPADSTTYYVGIIPDLVPATVSGNRGADVPRGGTIKRAQLWWYGGTAGSNESISVYVRRNMSTSTLVQTIGDTAAIKTFTNTALSVAVATAERLEFQINTPLWGTNPNNVAIGGWVWIEYDPAV